MNDLAICTVVAKNYLAYARCLTDSFLAQHPEGQVFVLLVDEIEGEFDPAEERFTTILAKNIGISNFDQMAFRYFVYELSTAVKPYFFEYLFDHYGCQKLCYIDPDIHFFQRLDEISQLLESYGLLLLPHLTGFLEDGYQPDELSILKSGAYNLGFLGMAQHPELKTFLHWWQRKLYKLCLGEQERGLFLDQKWMDLVPTLFSSVYICRDPGYNVAYWNLNHRSIEATEKGYLVEGNPLKFFHFSGFNWDNIEAVARYQNRYTLSDLEHLRPLFSRYRDELSAHGHERIRHQRYVYDYFDNGMSIPPFARYLWRELDENGQRWPTPYKTADKSSFIHWLNEPIDKESPLLTNLALELYRRQPQIHKIFPQVLERDRLAFAHWFVEQANQSYKIDRFFVEPIVISLTKVNNSDQEPAIPSSPNRQRITWSGRVYLKIRNFVNKIGIGQRIRAVIGPETVLAIRQFFFFGSTEKVALYKQSVHVPPYFIPKGIQQNPDPLLRQKHPLGLNVVGYLREETGVGEVARSILKALHKQNFPVAQTSINGYDARREDLSVINLPDGNPYPVNLLNINADQIPTVQKALGPEFFRGKYNIGFWFWELSHFPENWHDRFRYVNEIWVGSSFVQATIAQVAPVPVVNMRIPIIPPNSSLIGRSELGLPADKHIFLFVFDGLSYLERKNPLGLIQAYRAAFEPHFQDTILVIKATNLNLNPELTEQLQQEMKRISGILIDKYLNRDELNGLFQACDTYVSLHRSEGFGMTIAESMALGKPVIATAYSANMDFMNLTNSYPVAYRLVELEQDHGTYRKGNVWANPDLEDAATLMRRVVDSPDEAQQKGARAKQDIEQFYGVNSVSQAIINRLEIIQQWSG